jgi:hypothetical protein
MTRYDIGVATPATVRVVPSAPPPTRPTSAPMSTFPAALPAQVSAHLILTHESKSHVEIIGVGDRHFCRINPLEHRLCTVLLPVRRWSDGASLRQQLRCEAGLPSRDVLANRAGARCGCAGNGGAGGDVMSAGATLRFARQMSIALGVPMIVTHLVRDRIPETAAAVPDRHGFYQLVSAARKSTRSAQRSSSPAIPSTR